MDMFNYFSKSENVIPLALSICINDSDHLCMEFHGITLVGVKKLLCKGGEILYTGIFRNSYGKKEENYDLNKIIEGMIKHKTGYLTIKPCQQTECQNPPLLANKKTNMAYHLVEVGDIGSIKKLRLSAEDINRPGLLNLTPLNRAIWNGHVEMARELLKIPGVDVNLASADGLTPLYYSIKYNLLEITEELLKNPNININQVGMNKTSPLMLAIHGGYNDIFENLYKRPELDVNQADIDGTSPLLVAIRLKNLDIVRKLLKHPSIHFNGAYQGKNIFENAIIYGNIEIFTELHKQTKYDLNKKGPTGNTLLELALSTNQTEIAKYIQSHTH